MEHLIRVGEEVEDALADHRPVVALETTLVAHGFPSPDGIEVALASEEAIRTADAVPATIGVLDGRLVIGLTAGELERFTPAARKLGPRDLAACAVQAAIGATTVGATLVVAAAAGIRFMGTGGLGGVHRGYPSPPDVSADLGVCARVPGLIVSSGVKSLLDLAATAEVLETLGVPVLGYRVHTLPRFYAAGGGPPVSARVDDVQEASQIADLHWRLGGNGILVGRPPEESLEVDDLIEEILAEANERGIVGQDVTPFVLAGLHDRSGGVTRRVNRDLIVANAGLAAEIAVAHASL